MKPKYRNLQSLISDQGVEIDPGALWEFDKSENKMILIDEDEFQTAKPTPVFISEHLYKRPSQD